MAEIAALGVTAGDGTALFLPVASCGLAAIMSALLPSFLLSIPLFWSYYRFLPSFSFLSRLQRSSLLFLFVPGAYVYASMVAMVCACFIVLTG